MTIGKMEDSDEMEDTLQVASKTWNRTRIAASKAGYREGIEDGKKSVTQDNFNIGYKEAFKTAFALGKYKGLATALSKDHKHPPEIEAILDKTVRGACYICIEKLRTDANNEESFTRVMDDQRKHSAKIMDTLHNYFEPLLKERGIDINEMSFQ